MTPLCNFKHAYSSVIEKFCIIQNQSVIDKCKLQSTWVPKIVSRMNWVLLSFKTKYVYFKYVCFDYCFRCISNVHTSIVLHRPVHKMSIAMHIEAYFICEVNHFTVCVKIINIICFLQNSILDYWSLLINTIVFTRCI